MNLANFNIKDFFISNNLLICENSNNILTATKNILIYQIFIQKKCVFACIQRTQRSLCGYTFFEIGCLKTPKKYLKTDAKIFS